jgi:uncharacterized membrane protein YkvA (DUF1232 family)
MLRFFNRVVDWIATPYTVYQILKDPGIARGVKWRATGILVLMFAYVVSPLDIIPDFVPFAGWLDDLIVVPLAFAILRQITPGLDIIEKRNRSQANIRRFLIWTIVGLVALLLLGLAWLGILIYAIIRLASS